jgi:hypothetical protein
MTTKNPIPTEMNSRIVNIKEVTGKPRIGGIEMLCGYRTNLVYIIFSISLVVGMGLGCITTDLITEEKTFTGFTAIDAGNGFHLRITQGSEYSITVTTNEDFMENITVNKTGDTLTIGLKPGNYDIEKVILRARITLPALNELVLSGGAHCRARGFDSNEFVLNVGGGSHVDELSGSANNLIVRASGGSHLSLGNFKAKYANVTLLSGSHATIYVDGNLDADARGGSHLYYKGNPTLGDISESGGSHVTKR